MSFEKLVNRKARLVDLIEVEVCSDEAPSERHVHGLHGLMDQNPLKALEELAEKMSQLDAKSEGESCHTRDRDEAAKAIFEMQRHLEHFQRQSAILKRLMNKLH